MEAGDQTPPGGAMPGDEPSEGQPSQEELRAQLEQQLKKVRVEDLVAESLASIINLTARRIAKDDERDLGQARVGIDAAQALIDLVDEQVRPQFRDALSQVQMLFARHAGGEGGGQPDQGPPAAAGEGAGPPGGPAGPRGPGLWTPPGS